LVQVEHLALLDDALGLGERLGVGVGGGRLARLGEAVVELLAELLAGRVGVGREVLRPQQVRRRLAVAEADGGVLGPEERGVRLAVCGSNSEMWIPGTEVGMARNGPPVSVPGFGSQDSSWLRPPERKMTTTRFWARASSALAPAEANPAGPSAAAAPAPRKA